MKLDDDHDRSISRRAALGLLATLGAGYTIFGPRGGKAESGRPVVLDYWEKWTGHEGEAMLEIVDRFNRAQDRITVRYFATASIEQKAMVAIAGGNPPDVLGLWSYSLPAYAESNALLELGDLSTTYGLDEEHYASAIWPLLHFENRRWAAVNTCGTVALYYDRRAFRDAGLDPDRPPATIEALEEHADRLTSFGPGGSITRAGFLPNEPGWWSWAWGYSFGGRLYDPAQELITADAPENREAYRWVQRFPERYGTATLNRLRSTFGNYASMQQSFLAGKTAMQLQGPWLANMLEAFAPQLDYAAAPFPVIGALTDPRHPSGILECDILVIPRGAPHPEAAVEFLAFTQRQDNVELLSLRHAKGSPLRSVSPSFRERHPNRALDVHDAILRSPAVFTAPRLRTWPQYRDELNAGFDRIWSLAEPADAVLESVQRRAQAQLDHALRRRKQRSRTS